MSLPPYTTPVKDLPLYVSPIKVLDHGFVRLISFLGNDQSIVEAARVSYGSESKGPETDKKLLFYLYKNRHTSPFEMCKIIFNIKMPIFVMRQFVRHRMQNMNEVSARYTQLPAEFYIPTNWRRQDKINKQGSVDEGFFDPALWGDKYATTTQCATATSAVTIFCSESYALYESLIHEGVAKEMARFVLPVNIYTEIRCCWDLKNLLHYFSLRDDPHAQWEHQQFAFAMKQITRELFPWVMEAYDKFKFPCVESATP